MDIKCDYCKLKAEANYQKIWAKFKISRDGEYKQARTFNSLDIEEPTGTDNIHLCEKHEKEWLGGKIKK
jgi:hypothetical protein